ncbi:Uncharacterized protein Adt_23359 [Abeliophyllum distichum]|uniref:RNase H type-1 domain-containing protein n=1 Tax=Abeliophyllum distichum TaxID=126358 RepID=A0ABD1SAM6_9LAMI
MTSPKNKNEVQILTGRVAALNRFMSRAPDWCHPFFKAIKKSNDLEWTAECEKSLVELKTLLQHPPILSKPTTGKTLRLYLVVSQHDVSSVLIRLDGEVEQWFTTCISGKNPLWVLFVDGSFNKDGSGTGVVLIKPNAEEMKYALKFEFKATNNDAEYEAVIHEL